jgi:hypothetical protein
LRFGRDTERVRSLSATVSGKDGMPPKEAAVAFLSVVTTLPYDGAEPARARQWVAENATSGGKLTIGNANLELVSEEQAHVLQIVAIVA